MRWRRAFTLTELLVVMSIIATLAGLLLPAVQQAREASRQTACQNHLRQLGLALASFEGSRGVFPPSGWTVAAAGNPAGKFVGWRSLVMPHIEQQALGAAYDASVHWWEGANLKLGQERLAVFLCPSVPQRVPVLEMAAKPPRPSMVLPASLAPADYEALMGVQPSVNPALYAAAAANRSVMYRNSATRVAEITDGTSQTIVAVECSARPLVYRGQHARRELANDQGQGWIDSEGAFSLDGASGDGSLTGLGPIITPRALNATNENEPYSFHPSSAGCLFADGHVTLVSESIDLATFAALATRAVGEAVGSE